MSWPLVLLFCDASGAAWRGKWFANCGADGVRALGGPWDSKEAAQAGILATGLYSLRDGTSDTFDAKPAQPAKPGGSALVTVLNRDVMTPAVFKRARLEHNALLGVVAAAKKLLKWDGAESDLRAALDNLATVQGGDK